MEATNTKGKYLKDFTPDEIEAMKVYNVQDTELCYGVFKKLLPRTGNAEMKQIDATIRMLVEPKFVLDTKLLLRTLGDEKMRKHHALLDVTTMIGAYEAGMTDEAAAEAARTVLASSAKFSELLTRLGVEVPMKASPSDPEKRIPALAKTDQEFMDMQDHEDPMVAAAARGRLGVKSTILETRIEKFLEVGAQCGGLLPVPLRYCGADTTQRWSGWAYNPQNLPRIIPGQAKASDALRNCMRAPKGYKVVVADLSGIELRVNHRLWQVPYSSTMWDNDPTADLYKAAAVALHGVAPEEVTKAQRQLEKAKALGLGFGLSRPEKFVGVAKQMAQLVVTTEQAVTAIAAWRANHPEIAARKTGGWARCDTALHYIHSGEDYTIDPWGMCTTSHEGIVTPKGIIRYPSLHQEKNTGSGYDEWIYGKGRHKAGIYGGKADENLVQHLARHVVADNLLAVKKETGFSPVLTLHDELVYIAPDSEAEDLLSTLQGIMRTPPKWWPELVTWSEGDIADTYGAAK